MRDFLGNIVYKKWIIIITCKQERKVVTATKFKTGYEYLYDASTS